MQTKYNILMKYRYQSLSLQGEKNLKKAMLYLMKQFRRRPKSQSKAQKKAVFKSMTYTNVFTNV